MLKKIIPLVIVFSIVFAFAGDNVSKIDWQTLQKGLDLSKKEKKPLYVFIYSTYCGWCKKFKRSTLSDEKIIKQLSEGFVAAKLNTASNAKQEYDGEQSTERQLAAMFGIRGVPTSVFMDNDGKVIAKLPGYSPPETFANILRYISEGWYNDMSYQEFIESGNSLKRENK